MNFEHLMNNEDFMKKLETAENVEAMQEVFAAYGAEVSAEDLNRALALVNVGENEELSEDMLEGVSGGGFVDWLIDVIKKLGKRNEKGMNDCLNMLCK